MKGARARDFPSAQASHFLQRAFFIALLCFLSRFLYPPSARFRFLSTSPSYSAPRFRSWLLFMKEPRPGLESAEVPVPPRPSSQQKLRASFESAAFCCLLRACRRWRENGTPFRTSWRKNFFSSTSSSTLRPEEKRLGDVAKKVRHRLATTEMTPYGLGMTPPEGVSLQ